MLEFGPFRTHACVRTDGPVKQTINLITILLHLSEQREQPGKPERMDLFLARYLKQKYGDDKTVADNAYNLNDAIERFAPDDEQFALFNGVLSAEVSGIGTGVV